MERVGGRVLIVEDNLAMLYALRAQFAACGWEVSEAKTVVGAMAQLDPVPDWIVLDLWLADGDGEDVLRHVRRSGIASRVAVISAALDPERIAGLRRLQPDLIIPKPVGFTALMEACRAVDSGNGVGIGASAGAGLPARRAADGVLPKLLAPGLLRTGRDIVGFTG